MSCPVVHDTLFSVFTFLYFAFLQEVKEFLGEYKAKNILISKKFNHGTVCFVAVFI